MTQKVYRCEFVETALHGNVAVLGYLNENYVTLDIVTESTYTFLKTLSSDYPIGNFIKLPNIKIIISKGIRTKYSFPTI